MAGDAGGSGHGTSAAAAAAAPPPPAAPSGKERTAGMRDYLRVLSTHHSFRLLWLAETVDNIGSWLSYVATLQLVQHLSGGSGLALSAVVIIRFLPSLLLAPVCGVVADRCNRVRILVAAALIDAGVVALLAGVPLLRRPSAQIAALYSLLTLQFSAAAFYDPARKALVPVLVPAADLSLATTIDSFAWSLTGAVGASAGGVLASRLGVPACFLLDALTYLVAAWCAHQLPAELGAPDAMIGLLKKRRSGGVELSAAASIAADTEAAAAAAGAVPQQQQQRRRGRPESKQGSGAGVEDSSTLDHPAALTHAAQRHHAEHAAWELEAAEVAVLPEHEEEQLLHARSSSGSGSLIVGGKAGGGGVLAAAGAALAEGWRALAEGWRYVSHPSNREVAALVLMKSTAALTWGAVDVLNVFISEMPSMQALGDASTTLGFIFAVVGFGCFIGPVSANAVFAPTPPSLRWGVATSYVLFAAGLLLMLFSPSIALVLLSTFVRSMGSACLWVYSTLLMQQRVPNELLGRISALDGAFYTISESASSVFGGAAFDVLHLSLRAVLLILTSMAGGFAAAWCGYAWAANRGAGGGRRGYAAVATADEDGAALT